jgi:hypothetical protein
VVKKVVQEKPKNVFAMLDIEQELEEQEVEEPELKKNSPYFDWWEEMKDDMSYLAA